MHHRVGVKLIHRREGLRLLSDRGHTSRRVEHRISDVSFDDWTVSCPLPKKPRVIRSGESCLLDERIAPPFPCILRLVFTFHRGSCIPIADNEYRSGPGKPGSSRLLRSSRRAPTSLSGSTSLPLPMERTSSGRKREQRQKVGRGRVWPGSSCSREVSEFYDTYLLGYCSCASALLLPRLRPTLA